jgi:hypothetical protein
MKVKVLYFALARDLASKSTEILSLPDRASVSDRAHFSAAVNESFILACKNVRAGQARHPRRCLSRKSFGLFLPETRGRAFPARPFFFSWLGSATGVAPAWSLLAAVHQT